MSGFRPERSLTLGFHPTARGFGWIVFEGPFAPYAWGLFTVHRDKNAKCLRKIERLFDRYAPEAFVIEAFDKRSAVRSGRIQRLCLSAVALAADRGAELAVLSRGEIKTCFAQVGAQTRDEIAQAVTRQVPALAYRLPKRRKAGDSEDKRLALFCAAALVQTFYHYGASSVFEDLRGR